MAEKNVVYRATNTGKNILFGVLAIISVIIVGYVTVWLVNWLPGTIKSFGSVATSTTIVVGSFWETVIKTFLGTTLFTWESLILHLAIFIILFFALSDIVNMFSSFNETTAWVIGFGLAIIAGVTRIVAYIAGVFAITAGIGAIGIALIVIAAVIAAVILNMGLRGPLKTWQENRQIEIEKTKARKGTATLTEGLRTAAAVGETAAEIGEK